MSEELLQRNLVKNPEKIGKWDFYNIGATTIKALKEYGIIRNVSYEGIEKKKVDAIIVQKKNVIAIIEYKKPSQFKTKNQQNKAIKQEIEVAKKLGSKIIIATDTKDTIWINVLTGKRIKNEDGKEVKTLFDPKTEKIAELIEKINCSINERNNNIKPKQLVNPTDLAKQIWQDIWSVSGATPENCLYTFVELFIFKYLSDLGVLKGTHNFYKLIEMYQENTENEVLEHYADTVRKKIKDLFPENPIDKTTIINGTIFVSKDQKAVDGYSGTFRTVLEKFNKYGKLEHIDYEFKSRLFESFLKESISKKNWGQFFTPLKVVRSIVEMAKDDIKEGVKICDPACGVGKFLLEPIITKLDYFYDIRKEGIRSRITIHGFDKGFDRDEQKTIILAKANMLIYFSDLVKDNIGLTKDFAKLFNESFTLKTNSILGTLSEPVEEKYDLILTNPPYVTSGSSNLKDEIKKDGDLVNYYKINAMGVEGLFMEWIIRALKPNGKAYIVIPDGILNRQNDKHLRKFILDECYIDGIISLPIKTFFTTPKKTYILCITKKANKQDIQKDPVFTYLVSEIGESRDIYRFDIEQNDLREAVELFNNFKGNKKGFEKINSDKRCKIQLIQKFNPDNHWSIDRWWTKEEQIKLGILGEDKSMLIEEFPDLLEEVANNIVAYKEEILGLNEKKKFNSTIKQVWVTDIFKILGEENLTKIYINANKGDYPVYSGQIENGGIFGFINSYKYNEDILTWVTYGNSGRIFRRTGKFNIGRNNCGLKPLNNRINLDYIKYIAEPIFLENIKGDKQKSLPQSIIKEIQIPIPINKKGEFDIEAQKKILEKYKIIEDIKQKIKEYKKKINGLNVEIKSIDGETKSLKIKDIFNLSVKTNNSKFTKTFINKNKGKIPVYSASKFPDAVDYGCVKDNLKEVKYFKDCLTWNIDGSIGKAHYRKDKFSLSEKVIPLIIKDVLKNKIDITFLKYAIENEFSKHFFGFGNKAGKGKIKDIKILFPINSKGKFNLEMQKQIAEKYKKIEEIKSAINIELDKIAEIKINFLK